MLHYKNTCKATRETRKIKQIDTPPFIKFEQKKYLQAGAILIMTSNQKRDTKRS